MHRKAITIAMAVALLGGLLAFGATPAHAAVPFDTQNFQPDDTYAYGSVEDQVLSDRFDGTDALAHLTNVSTTDTERVKWFTCPGGTVTTAGNTFGGVSGDQSRLGTCSTVIGEDTTARQPTGGNAFAPTDEAYDINWDIPGALDGATVDILALACIGAGDDVEGSDANCRGDIENDVRLEDGQTGTVASQTSAGEMTQICLDGPTLCAQSSVPGTQTQAQLDARFTAFVHGMNVPNDGFFFRATSSDDLSGLQTGTNAGDAQTDPHQAGPFGGLSNCTSTQTATNFERWECSLADSQIPDNAELFTIINEFTGASGAGFCDGAGSNADACALDSHYVVSVTRSPTTAVSTFLVGNADCTTPDKEETNLLNDDENIRGCITDQFGDAINNIVTFELAGPEGAGIVSATDAASTCTLHDHDADGRNEHAHCQSDTDGDAEININDFSTTGGEQATPGDVTVTFCNDPQGALGTTSSATAPTGHGCGDTSIKDSVLKHYITAPSDIELVFRDPAVSAQDNCLTGDKFKENQRGDTDVVLACTFDADGNFVSTTPEDNGRLQWFLGPVGGGELTATRFSPNPPNETGTDGTVEATLEAFRAGNDEIEVCLQNDPGGNVPPGTICSSIQKRVTEGPQPPPPGGGCNRIIGTNGADVLNGTSGRDCINGRGGRDVLRGRGAGDTLRGGAGGDRLLGGRGNDRLLGGRGRDRLNGGRGSDSCAGGPGRDTVRNCP